MRYSRLCLHRSLPLLLLAACTEPQDPARTAWHRAIHELVATEHAFARLARDSTVQFAFLTYLDRDALLFRPGPVVAREALEREPFPTELLLAWEPAWADIAQDGSVGFTTGPWQSGRRGQASSGGAHGRYVTIWRRTPEGPFRAILDFGTTGPPADPEPLMLAPPPLLIAWPEDALASVREAEARLTASLGAAERTRLPVHFAEQAWIMRDGSSPRVGRLAADSAYAEFASNTAWTLAGADVADSRDLAWAWGTWNGAGEDRGGAWLRIWRRTPGGDWVVILDAVTGSP